MLLPAMYLAYIWGMSKKVLDPSDRKQFAAWW